MAERPVAGGRELREELPAHAPGRREQHQRQPDHRAGVRADEGLRGRGVRGLLTASRSAIRGTPTSLGIAQYGVVYTGGKSKIAEHGGDDPQDRDVPILVVLPGLRNGRVIGAPVETTQIAPTILSPARPEPEGPPGRADRGHEGPAQPGPQRRPLTANIADRYRIGSGAASVLAAPVGSCRFTGRRSCPWA